MAEYIDRQAAIEAVCGCVPHSCDIGSCGFACSEAYALSKLPSADVRPVVRAHWTDHRTIEHDGEWYCSACGKEITIYMGPDSKDRYAFCPNCGADMREV